MDNYFENIKIWQHFEYGVKYDFCFKTCSKFIYNELIKFLDKNKYVYIYEKSPLKKMRKTLIKILKKSKLVYYYILNPNIRAIWDQY